MRIVEACLAIATQRMRINVRRLIGPEGSLGAMMLMSVTEPSSLTFLSGLQRVGNKRFQHQQRGCRDHRRAMIAPALTSNSSVVSRVGGGSVDVPTVEPARTALMTRSTWLSASAAVASTVALSALPTALRSCEATAGHAGRRASGSRPLRRRVPGSCQSGCGRSCISRPRTIRVLRRMGCTR